MFDIDMAEKYWDLGNAVTGFTVLQAIAFLYALSDQDKFEQIKKAKDLLWLPLCIASSIYVAAVGFCYYAATQLNPAEAFVNVYWATMWGQVFVVATNTFGVVVLAWLIFHHHEKNQLKIRH
nr:hypothetical protein [uncultured Dongia sp.]